MEKDMTRRQIIKAAPALAAIPAVSVASEPEDQIIRLFREWYDLSAKYQTYEVPAGLDEDRELARLFCTRLRDIERELEAIPSVTAADFAAKALITHEFGDYSGIDAEAPFWMEARRLTGVTQAPGRA